MDRVPNGKCRIAKATPYERRLCFLRCTGAAWEDVQTLQVTAPHRTEPRRRRNPLVSKRGRIITAGVAATLVVGVLVLLPSLRQKESPALELQCPVWSPSLDKIAFQVTCEVADRTFRHLVLFDLKDEDLWISPILVRQRGLSWDPSGDLLSVVVEEWAPWGEGRWTKQRHQIWVMSQGRVLRQIAVPGNHRINSEHGAVFSPDGTRLAWIERRLRDEEYEFRTEWLVIANLANGHTERTKLPDRTMSFPSTPVWDRSGRYLVAGLWMLFPELRSFPRKAAAFVMDTAAGQSGHDFLVPLSGFEWVTEQVAADPAAPGECLVSIIPHGPSWRSPQRLRLLRVVMSDDAAPDWHHVGMPELLGLPGHRWWLSPGGDALCFLERMPLDDSSGPDAEYTTSLLYVPLSESAQPKTIYEGDIVSGLQVFGGRTMEAACGLSPARERRTKSFAMG